MTHDNALFTAGILVGAAGAMTLRGLFFLAFDVIDRVLYPRGHRKPMDRAATPKDAP